ncbi:MAG: glycoside hydrolase family 5 protein [Patescibacteria group bacterium]|nr:glycoside hydrolase family 5 protein [Patescibacteria group bacterium]
MNDKGDESDRPDLLKVMMDMSDFEIGGRECDILHFWEMEERAFDQSRVQQIVESAKDQGYIVILHHPMTSDDGYKGYKNTAQVSPSLFTEAESSQITEMTERGLL